MGHELKQARLRAGVLSKQAAFDLGVSKQTLWLWETGRTVPRPKTIEAIKTWIAGLKPGADQAPPARAA